MQALDIFISPVPGFNGDIPILAIPVSVRPPSDQPTSDPSVGASASASKTQAGNWKATATTPQKKAKKATGRASSRIKINETVPKAPALTPSSVPRQKVPIH
jgi:hypothetical protein